MTNQKIEVAKEVSKQDEDYLTRKELQSYLGISNPQVHNFIRKGILKAYKLGGKLYFLKGEVRSAIAASRA